jgi:hypothetical protein
LYQIEFTSVRPYRSEREGISVPIVLKAGENSVRLSAKALTVAQRFVYSGRS